MTKDDSEIKQRMSRISKQLRAYTKLNNLDHNFTLMRYAGERLLYRISVSKYSDLFVLKGAMLFSLWTGKLLRQTKDIDFLGYDEDSDERFKQIFYEIGLIKPQIDDGIEFDVEKISVEQIRENQAYQGKHIKMPVKGSSIVVQIDVGFGDFITPQPSEAVYPSLVADLPETKIKVYNKETVIAEKFEAIVSLGTANSRMKDFYDIWVMSNDFDFEGRLLFDAVKNTFARRKTALPSGIPDGLNKDLMLTIDKITMWNNFLSRNNLDLAVGFADVIDRLCIFLIVPIESLNSKMSFSKNWKPSEHWH